MPAPWAVTAKAPQQERLGRGAVSASAWAGAAVWLDLVTLEGWKHDQRRAMSAGWYRMQAHAARRLDHLGLPFLRRWLPRRAFPSKPDGLEEDHLRRTHLEWSGCPCRQGSSTPLLLRNEGYSGYTIDINPISSRTGSISSIVDGALKAGTPHIVLSMIG